MKYSRNLLKRLELALLETKDWPYTNAGICFNVYDRMHYSSSADEVLDRLMRLWPKHSGRSNYPVPGGIYPRASASRTLWDKSTQYGRNRGELLDFLIEQVQAMIREIDDYIEEHELEYLEG